MIEVYFTNDENLVMHWHHFVMHKDYVRFELCITVSNFKVNTQCLLFLEELIQFRDDLRKMKDFKTCDVIFCPLGEFIKIRLMAQKDGNMILKGYICDTLFPQSDFEFSCKIDGKVVSDLIVASELILNDQQ